MTIPGEVYKAKDLKLGRDVAIKVLPEKMASDPQRLRRFEQEARAASALNHPNIVTIYEIGAHEGTPFIYATQMAEGLAKAHQAGIVHRDLKQENMIISDDGYIKILDFGLAKLVAESDAGSEILTAVKDGTTPGTILGTVGYMSPEQAKGESADFRSDQFSLGSVLLEMATGQRAFASETPAQTLAAIIDNEPVPMAMLDDEHRPRFTAIVKRCMAKLPADRYDSTGDLAGELRSAERSVDAGPRRRAPLLLGAGGLAALAALVVILNLNGMRETFLGGTGSPSIDSIAVLPLDNLSGDPAEEYFADGMTDTLISGLAKIKALKVISRTSVMQYKSARQPLPEIAQALNVNGVVTGSVFREGDRVRITVQLIDALNDRTLWTESYVHELTSILALQGEVARAIAREIEVTLTPVEEARLTDVRTVDREVQDAYFRGRFFLAKDTVEDTQRALGYFQEAIAGDPSFAFAHADVAQAYSDQGFAGALAPRDVNPKAKAAARRALELEDLAEAHAALGYIAAFYDWDWTTAEQEFKRAFELNPNYEMAHLYYHWLLTAQGREQEAAREIETALELAPLSLTANANVAWHANRSGEFERAIAAATKTLELDPSYTHALWFRAIAYLQTDRLGEAIADLKAATAISETPDLPAWLGHAYALAGRRDEALGILSELEARSEVGYVPADRIAVIHIGLGDTARALDYLEQALEERAGFIVYLKIDSVFDSLRSEPRFQALIRRMNFPE